MAEIAVWAEPLVTSSGVLVVDEHRVIFHSVNYGRSPATSYRKMVFENGLLYVASDLMGIEMLPAKQKAATKKMKLFVLRQMVRGGN